MALHLNQTVNSELHRKCIWFVFCMAFMASSPFMAFIALMVFIAFLVFMVLPLVLSTCRSIPRNKNDRE